MYEVHIYTHILIIIYTYIVSCMKLGLLKSGRRVLGKWLGSLEGTQIWARMVFLHWPFQLSLSFSSFFSSFPPSSFYLLLSCSPLPSPFYFFHHFTFFPLLFPPFLFLSFLPLTGTQIHSSWGLCIWLCRMWDHPDPGGEPLGMWATEFEQHTTWTALYRSLWRQSIFNWCDDRQPFDISHIR